MGEFSPFSLSKEQVRQKHGDLRYVRNEQQSGQTDKNPHPNGLHQLAKGNLGHTGPPPKKALTASPTPEDKVTQSTLMELFTKLPVILAEAMLPPICSVTP